VQMQNYQKKNYRTAITKCDWTLGLANGGVVQFYGRGVNVITAD